MSPSMMMVLRRGCVSISVAAFALLGYGCSSNSSSTLSAQFTASNTPAGTLRLVKLVQKTASGGRVVVQAVIYGPDTTLDMYAFAFDVAIGDTTVVKFADGSSVAGDALQAFAPQTIEALVGPDLSDASHVVVGVSKLGGGVGNGIADDADDSAVIVEMAFDVLRAGTSSLTISSSTGGTPLPPTVEDSTGAAIGTITFDAAAATMTGISTGGGGY